jgi:hypothetical protein
VSSTAFRHAVVQRRERVPGTRRLECLRDRTEADERVARVRRPDERVSPRAGRARARAFGFRALAHRDAVVGDGATVIARAFDRARDPRPERVVGGFEREEQQRFAGIVGPRQPGLDRIEEPAVRGVQAGLGDGARGVDCAFERAEARRRRCAERRPVLQAHPRLGDHSEDALGAEQRAVR